MTCKLEAIFKRQAEFVASLYPIYKKNGFTAHAFDMPWPLNYREYQEEFRLLAWRCTEEVYEAIQVYRLFIDDESFQSSSEARKAFNEEVSDALHFFVELCLATGISSQELITYYEGCPLDEGVDGLAYLFRYVGFRPEESLVERWGFVIEKVAKAMMCLKQRPWRTDDRQTDDRLFKGEMSAAFMTFISACKRSGINADSLYEAYFAKGKINDQRTADQKL